jgi:hypothetical protein
MQRHGDVLRSAAKQRRGVAERLRSKGIVQLCDTRLGTAKAWRVSEWQGSAKAWRSDALLRQGGPQKSTTKDWHGSAWQRHGIALICQGTA